MSNVQPTVLRRTALQLLILVLCLTACAPVPARNVTPVKVYYAGEDGSVKTALDLAVRAGTVTLVRDMVDAQTLVLNGLIPEGAAERIRAGAGLVLILGQDTSEAKVRGLLGESVSLLRMEAAVSLTNARNANDPLLTEIIWNGAPQVRERWALSGLNSAAWQPLVSVYENGEGFLYQLPGRKFVITSWLSDSMNPQIQEWGYFNYLIYHLAARAAGNAPLAFADYPSSPLPHANDRNGLFVFLGVELLFFFSAYLIVRRYSLAHPEALDSLVADKARFQGKEASTAWEQIGFHRPLSGLLVGMGIGILLLFVALVPCMPVFFFFYALAGGWDDAGLREAADACRMTGFLRPIVNAIFIAPSRWGARISPLHNRFPITMRELAQAEARSLTEEKVKLVTEA